MSRFSDLFQEEVPDPEPGFNENASDRDGDGLVQDGTKFERPASTPKSSKKKPTLG
jgi:hypothetical protein